MTHVEDKHREIARALIAPVRRVSRPSTVVWDATNRPAPNVGPIAIWSAGRGPCVVLVHGWEADHRDMDAFVAPLVAAGRRVVAFDLPAHGETPGETATLPELAAALTAVSTLAGEVDAIVAHSVGCAATAAALAEGLRVRRAAFIAPPLRYEAFVRYYADQAGVEGDALVAALGELGLDIAPLDIRKSAARIAMRVPLLLVHSMDDRVCDASNSSKIAALWNGSTVEFVEGLGHNRILRDPGVVGRIATFVTAE